MTSGKPALTFELLTSRQDPAGLASVGKAVEFNLPVKNCPEFCYLEESILEVSERTGPERGWV